jgi:hypothetical protein
MTLDRINDEIMIKGLMDEMKMKKIICKRNLFERGGEGLTVTTWTFGIEIFVA